MLLRIVLKLRGGVSGAKIASPKKWDEMNAEKSRKMARKCASLPQGDRDGFRDERKIRRCIGRKCSKERKGMCCKENLATTY
jgi:hypothetical protein